MTKVRLQWGLIIAIILVSLLTLGFPVGDTWPNATIFWQLRVPRLIFALLGGAGLAVSALLFQTTLRNRYVDGAMLGLASGTELLNAVLAIIWAPALPWRVLTGAIFAMGCLLILRVTILRLLRQPLRLLLGGLAVAMFLSAVTALITNNQGFFGKSLATVTIQDTWLLAIIMFIGLLVSQLNGNNLRYFALPSLHLRQLGINEARLSWPWQLVAAAYLGAISAILGTTLFVGLILAQLIVLTIGKNAHQRLIPTALIGALSLSLSDFLAHWLRYPTELPTGALLMAITAPLLLLLWRGQHAN